MSNEIKVTTCNATGKYPASVRVRLNGAVIALVRLFNATSRPLRFIRTNPYSQERKELTAQLKRAGISDDQIKRILDGADKT